jgi:hypothetical protein
MIEEVSDHVHDAYDPTTFEGDEEEQSRHSEDFEDDYPRLVDTFATQVKGARDGVLKVMQQARDDAEEYALSLKDDWGGTDAERDQLLTTVRGTQAKVDTALETWHATTYKALDTLVASVAGVYGN